MGIDVDFKLVWTTPNLQMWMLSSTEIWCVYYNQMFPVQLRNNIGEVEHLLKT